MLLLCAPENAFVLIFLPLVWFWVVALVVGVVLGIVALLTCIGTLLVLPIAPFLGLWPVVTALHGGWLVLHEDWAAPFGSFGLGDMMFGGIEVKDRGDAA